MSSKPDVEHEVESPASADTVTAGDTSTTPDGSVKQVPGSDPPPGSGWKLTWDQYAETVSGSLPPPRPSWKMTWDEYVDKRILFQDNRANFPHEELAKHYRKEVAWEPDGSAIRASGEGHGEVWDKILAEGDDPQTYVYEYILHPDDVFFQ